MKFHKNDYVKISAGHVPNRTVQQVTERAHRLIVKRKRDLHDPDAKPMRNPIPWSAEENETFWKVIETHGKDLKLMSKLLPNRNAGQILKHCSAVCAQIKRTPGHKYGHLLECIEKQIKAKFNP